MEKQILVLPDYICRSLGSHRSRSQSPTKLNDKTVRNMAIPGKKATHHADPRYSLPLEMSAPHDGVGGGTPAPRKDRILSDRMVLPT